MQGFIYLSIPGLKTLIQVSKVKKVVSVAGFCHPRNYTSAARKKQ
jgi:hypothetical protein